MNIVMKREDLIRELKALLPKAREYDKKQKAKHKEEEKEALRKFREELRAALKMSYQVASNKYDGYRNGISIKSVCCPVSQELELKSIISRLELDKRVTLTLDKKGALSDVYKVLTFDYDERDNTVCD